MISQINSPGPWISVSPSPRPYVNNSYGGQGAGSVRFNMNLQCLEAYDGQNWVSIANGYVSIEGNGRMNLILEWAERQMHNDQRLKELIKDNPTLEDAYATYQKASEQLNVLITLTQTKNS
jgi:hypothetical protein